jgi:hypothetical protein
MLPIPSIGSTSNMAERILNITAYLTSSIIKPISVSTKVIEIIMA